MDAAPHTDEHVHPRPSRQVLAASGVAARTRGAGALLDRH